MLYEIWSFAFKEKIVAVLSMETGVCSTDKFEKKQEPKIVDIPRMMVRRFVMGKMLIPTPLDVRVLSANYIEN